MSSRNAPAALSRLRVEVGRDVYQERQRRRWSLAQLAARSGLSTATAHRVEVGGPASLEAIVAVICALNLDPHLGVRVANRLSPGRDADPVHAAMGEIQAEWLRAPHREVRLDEPYQHYQFAGRADVVVIDRTAPALLHIENRTLFPDIQEFAGVWNAKRSYLADNLKARLSVRTPWVSVDHVIVALWSSEVMRTIRLRRHSFGALAPDGSIGWAAWWNREPVPPGTRSTLVLLDPLPGARRSRRRWVGLDQIDGLDPRYRSYADALAALRAAGRA